MSKISCIFVIFAFAAISIETVTALHCWRCRSDASSQNWCGETLDATFIDPNAIAHVYVDCSSYHEGGKRPVCKKEKIIVNDVPVYTRSCSFQSYDTLVGNCKVLNPTWPSYMRQDSCNTCIDDGCNL